MNLRALGIEPTSTHSVGQNIQYVCLASQGQLRALLAALPIGGEVAVPDVGGGECIREARRGHTGFEIKRACHGAYGTWRAASPEEAEAWVIPALALAEHTCTTGHEITVVVPA